MTNLQQLLSWAQQQGMVSHQSNGTAAGSGSAGRKASQATHLVLLASNVQFWHTPDFEAFATIEVAGHQENWAVASRGFRRWLAHRFYQQEGTTPSSQALQDALNVLGGKAVFEGVEHPVWTRIAEDNGYIYLDLANDSWNVVEIAPSGWRVISSPPVKFRRSRGMLALPHPIAGGNVNDLASVLKCC
jgi:hypothetical protein